MVREKAKVVLTKLELEVMRGVWRAAAANGDVTVRDVVEGVNEGRRRTLAYNTVQTVLNILRDKGVLRVRAGQGRAFIYAPRISREQVTTSMVGELVERLFDGNVQPLLLNLVEREKLSRSELESLKRMIDERLDDGGHGGSGAAEGGR